MSELVLGLHPGLHDANAAVFEGYRLRAAVQLERLTRHKGDGRSYPDACIDEVLAIVGATRADVDAVAISRMALPADWFRPIRGWRGFRERLRGRVPDRRVVAGEILHTGREAADVVDVGALRAASGFRPDVPVHFYNHHEAHALPALFYTDWDDALLVTADAGGDMVQYSHRHFAEGRLATLYGGDECRHTPAPVDSLGRAYGAATDALGFRSSRHEGKLTGLAAYGQPTVAETIARRFSVDETGRVHSSFRKYSQMWTFMRELAQKTRREDLAASIQQVLEETMLASVTRLLDRHPARRLGVSGGVFANVRLNRLLAEELPIDEFFVFPPMGDEGLAAGGVLSFLLRRDGLPTWLGQRHRLPHLYCGRDFGSAVDDALAAVPGVRRSGGSPAEAAAEALAAGAIGAIVTGGCEYGPRALGARSILASPARGATNDELNARLDRSDFMPFAPVVSAERAGEVFEVDHRNAYACRFMTVTCAVRPAWRDRIPAVVHVDGTARPQTVTRFENPLYADILSAFERATGLPVLVNTSFNVHEEPIVYGPQDCARALADGRIDFVVTGEAVYRGPAVARGETARPDKNRTVP